MGQKSKHSAQTKGFPSKEKNNQYSLSVLVFFCSHCSARKKYPNKFVCFSENTLK